MELIIRIVYEVWRVTSSCVCPGSCVSHQIRTHLLIEGFLPADGFRFSRKVNEIKEFRLSTFSGYRRDGGCELNR